MKFNDRLIKICEILIMISILCLVLSIIGSILLFVRVE